MKNVLKENNGGGLQIERYDEKENLISVFTGIEYSEGFTTQDFLDYGDIWDYGDYGTMATYGTMAIMADKQMAIMRMVIVREIAGKTAKS